jgi:hypothetical protein
MTPDQIFALRTIEYMDSKGYRFSTEPGQVNIVYFEGLNYDLQLNDDAPDRWNDLRTIITFDSQAQPTFVHRATATTEPGFSATVSRKAKALGGVARLMLTQYQDAARVGFHKTLDHPALVQASDIWVHRDANQDMKRTGDPVRKAMGINHHSTRRNYAGNRIGTFSEGCCVGKFWSGHLAFMNLIKKDPRYLVDPFRVKFDFTIIDASDLFKFIGA